MKQTHLKVLFAVAFCVLLALAVFLKFTLFFNLNRDLTAPSQVEESTPDP